MKLVYAVDETKTHYLNVDLDVWSRSRLEPLAAAMERSARVLFVGPQGRRLHGAHFESRVWSDEDPGQAILDLTRLVRRLPPTPRRLWNGAHRRHFNVGIQAAAAPQSFELVIAPKALRAIADVNATVAITVYAPSPEVGLRSGTVIPTSAPSRGRRTMR